MARATSGDWRGWESLGSGECHPERRRATQLKWSNVCPVVWMPELVAQAGIRVDL